MPRLPDRRPRKDNPDRGVCVQPMPRHMQDEFMRFCYQLRHHIQSRYGTWRWAAAQYPSDTTNAHAIYLRACLKFINEIEHLGTRSDAPDRVH